MQRDGDLVEEENMPETNPSTQTGGMLVIGEVRNHVVLPVTLELVGKARQLADARNTVVRVFLMFDEVPQPSLQELVDCGADHVFFARHPSLHLFDPHVQTRLVVEVIGRLQPEVVLAGATSSGRTVLPAVAGKIHTGLTADCTGLDIEEQTGLLLQTRPAIGGNIMATIKTPNHRPQMATVRPRTFPRPIPSPRSGEIHPWEFAEEHFRSPIQVLDFKPLQGENENIQEMDVIVAGGKGVKRAETFEKLRQLAHLLDGGVGASRPTIESRWISYPHQVGLSGKVVSPKLYMAFGISGSVQHLAGMQTAEYIVAINKDPDAPIFQVANLGLCGDLFDILPRILQKIEGLQEEKP